MAVKREWASHNFKLYPGEYHIYADVTHSAPSARTILRFDRSGEVAERPWEESEMTASEIDGSSFRSLEGIRQVESKPKQVWLQASANFPYSIDERKDLPVPPDFESAPVAEELWPFSAESQNETGSRGVSNILRRLFDQMNEYSAYIKKQNQRIKREKKEERMKKR
jgi:hypothetical protein